jgi:hypothetical protein
MISFSWLLISVGFVQGALDSSLYQSDAPLWYRFSHLKNHFFERFMLVYTDLGVSPSTK